MNVSTGKRRTASENTGRIMRGIFVAAGLAVFVVSLVCPSLRDTRVDDLILNQADQSIKAQPDQVQSFQHPLDKNLSSITANYGKLPMSFEANKGQTDQRVRFLSRGSGYSLFLTSTEAVLRSSAQGQATNRRRPARNHSSII